MIDLHFNQSLAAGYHSGSQISRVLTEDWMARNMFCPVCGAPILGHYKANKPVADFFCEDCKSDFELKSKESKTSTVGKKIADGAYGNNKDEAKDNLLKENPWIGEAGFNESEFIVKQLQI